MRQPLRVRYRLWRDPALARSIKAGTAADLPDGASILYCPMCGENVHWHAPGKPFDAEECEDACARHLSVFHPRRFWLYRRLRWGWLISGFLG